MKTEIQGQMVGGAEGDPQVPRVLTYSEKEGKGIEGIVRCESCRKLVPTAKVNPKIGCPKCGNRRFNDVKSLSGTEMFLIWIGWIDFPDRDKFLKEFSRV